MKSAQALPQWIGLFLFCIGFMFLIPLLALMHIYTIPALWDTVIVETGWHYIMLLWVVADIVLVAFIFAYASEITFYRDKKAEGKSIDENAEESKFKPEPVNIPPTDDSEVEESQLLAKLQVVDIDQREEVRTQGFLHVGMIIKFVFVVTMS